MPERLRPRPRNDHDLDLLGSSDVIGHVTIGLAVGTFLLVVTYGHASISHGYGDTGLNDFGVTNLT